MAKRFTIGVDEVGRGCLAGPVVAAAVLLGNEVIEGLADSKKLGPKRRAAMAELVIEECIAYAYGEASVEEIDQLNVLEASLTAMQRAVSGIVIVPDEVLVDGDRCPDLPYPVRAVVKGDAKIPEIMAASIIAKQHRDAMMLELDKEHPEYGFARHKGYGTPEHVAALRRHGPCPAHRTTFAPVRAILAGAGDAGAA
ncbi:MAG: ribonuclease HII [Betaproteobacteria bacterium AqS2]|uniref:Ribonuclease HII n=1 Tax=Candidatus Amphirhobacter heronislandensis TaxID=1732024 RepID=A0A930UD82_9GAMM|nr:ribonuclease HII [Betaproteobacteria bacterium AqS2]